ncbi:MAG: penicillin-binding protein 2 [Candidatus Tectomicrobia bacterium]|uniref:Penicillin-binding protein 2 n=1 Tax=Tectimicrobiota bacterium TaxID=2528274 RepID=A0A932FV68_UNCTE|nr:penicillin-binding protein 2 [Candidatus Tectomicrobia bacterium]
MERRIRLVVLLLLGGLGVVTARLGALQLKGDPLLSSQAQRQYRQGLNLQGLRGTLYDRNRRELALSPRPGQRIYPQGRLAAQVLGFTGRDGRGLEGIEYLYERLLQGRTRPVAARWDARGKGLYLLDGAGRQEVDGAELVLTLDEVIQQITERELAAQMKRCQARGGLSIVMEPFRGEILALAVQPGFDPHRYREQAPSVWRNRAITDSFEPGSIFKVVALSAALQEGLASLEEPIYCEEGTLPLGRGLAMHDLHPYGWLSLKEVIAHSSNIGTIKVARRLGKASLYRYLRLFGFGSPTGVELPGEARGLVRPPQEWSGGSLEAISIGQEIGATAMQMTVAYAAIANGGYLVRPRLIRAVGTQSRPGPTGIRRVLSPETARLVTEALIQAVAQGTGVQAAVEGYAVAGKTGTAQKFDLQRSGYSPDRYLSSFVGFVPAHRPRIVILVAIDEPQGEVQGGAVAAPAFREIARHVLRYLERMGRRHG